MTGEKCPSTEEMEVKLSKRMFLTPHGPGSGAGRSRPPSEKRYNSFTPPIVPIPATANNLAAGKAKAKAASDESEDGGERVFADNSAGVSPIEIEALINGGFTAAKEPTAKNSLGLDIIAADVGYFATIQLGTPPRNFRVIMDSGSADLWVGAENCQAENGGGCGNHTFLGAQSSSTFQDTKKPFQITYGTGAVEGTQVTDNLVLAGLSLPKHEFGVAQVESREFSDDNIVFDGIMGLALSTLSNQGVLTPPESLASEGLIKEAIVSYKMSRLADEKNDGQITFGGLDTTKFDPKTLVTVENTSRNGFWQATMDSVTVNGKDIGAKTLNAILDTGTTVIIAPEADAVALHAQIPGSRSDGQGGFIIPCTTNAVIALSFGGREFEIDSRDLSFAPLTNNPKGDCISGISSGNFGGGNSWLVGDVFLKSAYFSTDAGKNTLSLAQLV